MLGLMAGLALLAVAPAASAEISIPGMNFSPNANDESLKMLGTFFGGSGSTDLLQNGGGPMASAMSALMNVFNGAILSLASIFAFYTIVSAVVQTAHDGEVLGKRYSSLWVPIRSAAGIAAIVPAGGFSAVQILVLWIAAQGVGLANQLWSAGVGALASPSAFVQQVPAVTDGDEVVRKIVPIAACLAANAEAIQNAIRGGATEMPVERSRVVDAGPVIGTPEGGAAGVELTTYEFGFEHPSGAFTSCGTFTFDAKTGGPTQTAIVNAQNAAAMAAMNTIRAQILVIGDPSKTGNGEVLRRAAEEYNRAVTQAARAAVQAEASTASQKYSTEVQALADKGWSAAGGSFMALSKAAQRAMAPIDAKTFFVSPAEGVAISDPHIASKTKGLTENAYGKIGSRATGSSGDDGDGVLAKLLSPFAKMMGSITGINAENAKNPILYWKAVGDTILTGVGIAVAIAMAATFASGMANSQIGGQILNGATGIPGGIQAVLRQVFLLLIFLIIGFATIGVTLAVYIPMLPYIIWISVLLSWLVAVAEAVIASPLWMMLHLNPEGDGVGAGTEAGYKFVAAIFLRPALSVISFFVACAVMFAIGGFVNATISEAYKATREDNGVISISGIFTYIGYLFVMGGLAISIVSKSFNLCLTIPETILRWIGSSLTGGENLAGETKNEFGGAVGVVSHAGHQSLTPGMRGKGKKQVSNLDSDPANTADDKAPTKTAGNTERTKVGNDPDDKG